MTSEAMGQAFERISKTAEVITEPDSKTVVDFHAFLGNFFKSEEIEPLEVFQRELSNKAADARYIFTALRDPVHDNKLVSAAYGSVQNGTLAIRFTLTEATNGEKYRGIGISQEADRLLIEEAKKFCTERGEELNVYICEAVPLSEGYWNRLEIEPGNGMRRLYIPSGEEIHYELPPLAWNSDGTPAAEGIPEHLQVAMKGRPQKIPTDVLESVLRNWWNQWYIRPPEEFESADAWELHKKTVLDILENTVLTPLRNTPELTLRSKKERGE